MCPAGYDFRMIASVAGGAHEEDKTYRQKNQKKDRDDDQRIAKRINLIIKCIDLRQLIVDGESRIDKRRHRKDRNLILASERSLFDRVCCL